MSTPEAHEGKPRAKAGRSKQTKCTSDHHADKNGAASKGFKLGNTPSAA
jgi:hypothetical protein